MPPSTLEKPLLALAERTCALFACRTEPAVMAEGAAALLALGGLEEAFFFREAADPGGPALAHASALGQLPTPEPDAKIWAVARAVWADRALMVLADGQAVAGRPPRGEHRLRRAVALPLLVEAQWLGALVGVGRAEPAAAPAPEAMRLLADQLALAWHNARLLTRAHHDPVTGLPTHGYLLFHLDKLRREVSAAAPGGLMVVDLDAFARVNQAAGSAAGDAALRDVAETLRETLREDALVARLGSDKFALLMAPDAKLSIDLRLREAAERVRAAIGAKTCARVRLSASIGGVPFTRAPRDGSAQALLAAANDALGEARRQGPGGLFIGPAPGEAGSDGG